MFPTINLPKWQAFAPALLSFLAVYNIGGTAAVGQVETSVIIPVWWLTLLQSMSQLKY